MSYHLWPHSKDLRSPHQAEDQIHSVSSIIHTERNRKKRSLKNPVLVNSTSKTKIHR